jgi:hypothetical protein
MGTVCEARKRWALPFCLATLLVAFAAGLAAGWCLWHRPSSGPALSPGVVRYRYRFGGEVVTHDLANVVAVTLYRTPEVVDQVVFNLESGRDYVLNADVLVDYRLPPDGSVERREVLNQTYHHYDPYLQAEKQGWHREWVNEQYRKWVGRLPSEQEWLEALNELTRGVAHHQMERWIQYSPQACAHFVQTRSLALLGREPTPAEARLFCRRLLDGARYEEIEQEIAACGVGEP